MFDQTNIFLNVPENINDYPPLFCSKILNTTYPYKLETNFEINL